MIRPCPSFECQKPIEIELTDEMLKKKSSDGINLTCPHCKDVLWLNKDDTLKSVSEEHRKTEQSSISSIEKERCVILSCNKETRYTKDTPIEERKYYARGAGQLCEECGQKYYPEGGD